MGRVLIVKFFPVHRDPRVLRQINVLKAAGHEVWTIGHGEAPDGVENHFQIPAAYSLPALKKLVVATKLLSLPVNKRYAQWPEVEASSDWVKEHRGQFDAVLANDVLSLPLALAMRAPVHIDLHDYALGQDITLAWRLGPLPLVKWASKYLKNAASASSTSPGMRELYIAESGRDSFLVLNAPPYRADLEPTPTLKPIRLVYMGGAVKRRRLDIAIKAVAAINQRKPGTLLLDYFVVPGEPSYIDQLERLAGDHSITGVRLNEPVSFEQIINTLHQYDVALAFFPPTTLSLKTTLPNKFFEAVQARIGVVAGPSPQMVPYLEKYGFGTATDGWDQSSLEKTLEGLTPQIVDSWKRAAENAAAKLHGESQDAKWLKAIEQIMEGQPN